MESTEQLQGKRTDHEEILVNEAECIDDEKNENINCSSCLGWLHWIEKQSQKEILALSSLLQPLLIRLYDALYLLDLVDV